MLSVLIKTWWPVKIDENSQGQKKNYKKQKNQPQAQMEISSIIWRQWLMCSDKPCVSRLMSSMSSPWKGGRLKLCCWPTLPGSSRTSNPYTHSIWSAQLRVRTFALKVLVSRQPKLKLLIWRGGGPAEWRWFPQYSLYVTCCFSIERRSFVSDHS